MLAAIDAALVYPHYKMIMSLIKEKPKQA